MFSSNFSKLKTNLKLAINRLKLMQKKKTELALKSRKEIADYLGNFKIERAKIRVEHIIREDYIVEAMEIIEMYCDLLLARFGMIQQMKALDSGLAEAVSSILWACPRLQTDIPELKAISDQITIKYGKLYTSACLDNAVNTVNKKLINRLSIHAPPNQLVENYLIEIAKSHNVSYEPSTEINNTLSDQVDLLNLDDTKPGTGSNNGNGGGGTNENYFLHNTILPARMQPMMQPMTDTKPGTGSNNGNGGGGTNENYFLHNTILPARMQPMMLNHPEVPQNQLDDPFSFPPPPYSSVDFKPDLSSYQQPSENPDFINQYNPVPKPPRKSVDNKTTVLPDVPNMKESDRDTDLSFDDLAKRFENLKKM